MNGVNKVIVLGTLGKDPEVRHFQNGDAVCNVSVAVNETWKDRESGEKKSKVEWINLVFTKKLAEIAGQYLKKGSKVYVEGKLQTRSWEKDGEKKYTTEVMVFDMQMLDGRPAESEPRAAPSKPAKQEWAVPAGDDSEIPF